MKYVTVIKGKDVGGWPDQVFIKKKQFIGAPHVSGNISAIRQKLLGNHERMLYG